MTLHPLDWAIILGYLAFALGVGVMFARRASRSVDEFFLSGRRLPWWLAGTSMVATTFAADTPLVVTGWVRDYGIWKNWLWWCFAFSGMLTTFVFARWWRRSGLMTKAELAELRYGGPEARLLRGVLGALHAGVTNSIVLCWVLLAMAKIVDVLLGIDTTIALVVGCTIALSYSLLAGFWGVVLTDLLQFTMAMTGAIFLAAIGWESIGGSEGLLAAAASADSFTAETLRFFPTPGPGGPGDASFWSVPVAAIAVYLGVSWWAAENVDGGALAVQRIAASRDERQGLLAVLWYNIAHFALRPWPWILVALASLVVFPHLEVISPLAGRVSEVSETAIQVSPPNGASPVTVSLEVEGSTDVWRPQPWVVEGKSVRAGDILARSDSERAYVAMMARYLPVGLLGLVVASLLAAFMSTIDTHVNLAASFFVNDLYRRFMVPDASPRHYVRVARLASVGVLLIGGLLASQARSISDLFQFFLAFLAGVGPIYVLRWLWWRVRASTEITAIAASGIATIVLTLVDIEWRLGPLAVDGNLEPVGRTLLVVVASLTCALISMGVTVTPDPRSLVPFYELVRPAGFWGPVRAFANSTIPATSVLPTLTGVLSGLVLIFACLFGVGFWFLEQTGRAGLSLVAGGVALVVMVWSLRSVD